MKETKLQKIFNFGSLVVHRAMHRKYEETQPEPQFEMVDNSSLLGIEVEVEGMHQLIPHPEYYWRITTKLQKGNQRINRHSYRKRNDLVGRFLYE